MATFDLIRGQLSLALVNAERITLLSHAILDGHGVDHLLDEIGVLVRDFSHINSQVMRLFPGNEFLAAELRHELECVQTDAVAMGEWLIVAHRQLERLYKRALAQPELQFGHSYQNAKERAYHESNNRQYRVRQSCRRANDVAGRVCGEVDRAIEIQPSPPASGAADKKPDVKDTASGLGKTEKAVLAIIKSQPKGNGINGKEIIKKLKDKGILIAESSLRKHILPKLIAGHGVVNHRAAGGYLIP